MNLMNRNQKTTKDLALPGASRGEWTAFELLMNLQCDLRAELGLARLPHWTKTQETPPWVKNICGNFRRTIFKSIIKLKPRRKVNWRYFGRMIGIMERYKTFLATDVAAILKAEKLDKISDAKWEKIQPLLGEESAREYYLKVLDRPATDTASLAELVDIVIQKQMAHLESLKQTAFSFLVHQSAKNNALFMKGMSEGYVAFLNEEAEFSGDDRRTSIHLELLAWQHDIEKMRRSIPKKNNKDVIGKLRQIPEYRSRTDDWFKEVFKDIALSIGERGRPRVFAGTSLPKK